MNTRSSDHPWLLNLNKWTNASPWNQNPSLCLQQVSRQGSFDRALTLKRPRPLPFPVCQWSMRPSLWLTSPPPSDLPITFWSTVFRPFGRRNISSITSIEDDGICTISVAPVLLAEYEEKVIWTYSLWNIQLTTTRYSHDSPPNWKHAFTSLGELRSAINALLLGRASMHFASLLQSRQTNVYADLCPLLVC